MRQRRSFNAPNGFARTVVLATLVTLFPAPLLAQAWMPGVSLGAGFASFGTESRPRWSPAPIVGSLRIALARFLVVEAEWMQPMRGREYREISEFTPSMLNGQPGVYGLDIYDDRQRLSMNSVYVMARSRMGRVSFTGGVGVGKYSLERHTIRTRTGCQGAWLVYCAGQFANGEFDFSQRGKALLVAGGVDVSLLQHVEGFVAGRIGGSNAGEEAALTTGLRMTVVPDRNRRGSDARALRQNTDLVGVSLGDRILIESDGEREIGGTLVAASRSEVTIRSAGRVISLPMSSIRTIRGPDSLANGLVIGMLGGVGVGAYLMYFDEPRTMPAAILLGGATGAFIDSLFPGRRLVYFRRTAVKIAPSVTPKTVGLNVVW